jgi:hypothetical protein
MIIQVSNDNSKNENTTHDLARLGLDLNSFRLEIENPLR